jgi:hypothetical protein
MDEFKKMPNGFNYVYEKDLKKDETVILKMPVVSSNKRGVNDIGWQTDGDVTISGTLAIRPDRSNTLWQEINDGDEVNKTVSALKIENKGRDCRIIIRAILN